jgi:hypothetical protein
MDTTLSDEAVAQSLAQDRPTIDAAIKTYMGLVVARSLTSQENVTNAEALSYARILLKAINGYRFENHKSDSNVSAVVVKIWQGLIDSDQKPSLYLGRVALMHAWDDIIATLPTENEGAALFALEFGDLMKDFTTSKIPSFDSNAHLIWDEPGAELERRRQRRSKRAESIRSEESKRIVPVVEEDAEQESGDEGE